MSRGLPIAMFTAFKRELEVWQGDKAVEVSPCSTLPTSGRKVNVLYGLIVADDTALAAPGLYTWTGSGWVCVYCTAAYDLGDWTGDVTAVTLIPGVTYVAAVTGEVTTLPINMSALGTVEITVTNSGTVAVVQPSATDRTAKQLGATGWSASDDAALALFTVKDDGTNVISQAVALA